ncbi:hypothetical protein D1B31_15700 [Neobacillus notoginsengisoli]|uniref:Uncharacterized protein n=1 Tax=Neobacillus notoginsengisoli TaxID=1578198 RepID=A0A417YQV3_9BACI|nr:hypothetical protein D1B31_15700 [Neobacillus notoginsengisoli]
MRGGVEARGGGYAPFDWFMRRIHWFMRQIKEGMRQFIGVMRQFFVVMRQFIIWPLPRIYKVLYNRPFIHILLLCSSAQEDYWVNPKSGST